MRLFNATETAAMLGYSYKYFQNLKRKNPSALPPSIKLSTRKEFWREETIEKFLEEKEGKQDFSRFG